MKRFNRDSKNKFGRRSSGGLSRGDSGREDSGRFGRKDYGRRFGRKDYGRSNRNSERQLHEITCDKCGERCEVPFKPTEGKPIYCNDCFRENKNSELKNKPGQFTKEFDQINIKLDKILKELEID